jgi:hypothetical protein
MKQKRALLTALALTLPLAGAEALTSSNSIYTVESGPGLPAVADISGDGRLDLICPNFLFTWPTNALSGYSLQRTGV